jgi:hypothetical protein
VIMPLIHDQFTAAKRIYEMNLGVSIDRYLLFPRTNAKLVEAGGFYKLSKTTVLSSVERLERTLQASSTPKLRLRCACFGKKLREDPRERGLKNVASIVWRLLEERERESDCMTERGIKKRKREKKEERFEERGEERGEEREKEKAKEEDEGDEWQEFECGLRLATHHCIAPEETGESVTLTLTGKVD